jgi:hypothetical protein
VITDAAANTEMVSELAAAGPDVVIAEQLTAVSDGLRA